MAHARGDIRVVAINDAIYPCWFADLGYACDNKWWEFHRGVPGFPGLKLRLKVVDEASGHDTNWCRHEDVRTVQSSGTQGFDPNPQRIRSGGNSGYQVLHLLAHLQVARIIAVGLDMNGRGHWFGDHPQGVRTYGENFENRIPEFEALAKVFRERGVRVVNCSPGSALRCFEVADLETTLKEFGHAT